MERYPTRKQPEFRGPAAFAANIFNLVGGVIDPIPHARRIERQGLQDKGYEDEVVIDLTERVESRIQQAQKFQEELAAAKARHPSMRS